jgi:hypothetical protein
MSDTYKIKGIATLIIALTILLTLVSCKSKDGSSSLQDYDSNLAVRVLDDSGVGLTEREKNQLIELTDNVGRLLYEIDEDYNPDDAAKYIASMTTEELISLAKLYTVKSTVLESKTLDIRVEGGNNGYILACYTLDYESKSVKKDKYIFIMDIAYERKNDSWVCTEVTVKGSAPTSETRLVRDDLTGNITLEYI